MSRIMIAGTGSGCGKTTITCAILGAWKAQNKPVVSFKAGPDYIDPMFHKKITSIAARNLDVFLMGEESVKCALKRHEEHICVIEGVMGLYDGISTGSDGSANHLALLTKTPVVLVVNAKGKSQSVCAEIQGYLNYEPNNICGILLNNVTEGMFPFYKGMIEERTGVPVFGFIPDLPQAHIGSRHLGLVTADEIADIKKKMEALAEVATKHIDMEGLLSVAQGAQRIEQAGFPGTGFRDSDGSGTLQPEKTSLPDKPVIYIAMDSAFCFYYEDNLDLLQNLGAEIRFFSPLQDVTLPEDAGGLILWGGYPELYAAKLQDNPTMRASLLKKIKSGMPVYAECGGFMYLQENLTDMEGKTYSMLGALPGHVTMTSKLQNFGYVTLKACKDNMLCDKGETIHAHSFHHSVSSDEGVSFTATKKSTGATYPCIVAQGRVFAGYPHIHFGSNPKLVKNLIKACCEYQKERHDGIYNQSAGD